MRISAEIAAEQSPVLHMKVLNRAHQLPLVKSASTSVLTFYQQAKDYSPLIASALSLAENGVELAGLMATPVVTRLDGNIHKVDDIACQALNAIETRYPCIKMDTEEVAALLLSASAGVRGGAEKYAGVLLESTAGQLALMGLAGYLRLANKVADITLPQDESESSLRFSSSNVALLNVAVLSDKLYRRIYKQSTVQLQQIQEVSSRALAGLQQHLTNLELTTKENLTKYGIADQTEKLWQQLSTTGLAVQQQTLVVAIRLTAQLHASTSAVTHSTLQLAQQISQQLVALYAAAAQSATHLPAAVQSALHTSKAHADKLYLQLSQVKSTEDLTTLALSQIRETMNLFQSSIAYLLQAASNLPLLKHAPGAISHVSDLSTCIKIDVSERWQSYMKPVQETEVADI